MIKRNIVKTLEESFCRYYQELDSVEKELREVEEIASGNVEELANLIKLFEEEIDVAEKLFLSDVLSNLKCEKVKNFLVEILGVSEDFTDKIWAAGNLLKFEDERAVEVLKKFVLI